MEGERNGRTHLELVIALAAKERERGALRERRRVDVHVLVEPVDRVDEVGRQHHPAEPPAGHRVVPRRGRGARGERFVSFRFVSSRFVSFRLVSSRFCRLISRMPGQVAWWARNALSQLGRLASRLESVAERGRTRARPARPAATTARTSERRVAHAAPRSHSLGEATDHQHRRRIVVAALLVLERRHLGLAVVRQTVVDLVAASRCKEWRRGGKTEVTENFEQARVSAFLALWSLCFSTPVVLCAPIPSFVGGRDAS